MEARILIIEDEPAIVMGLQDKLEASGFQVEVATDGNQGMELARRGGFDLILLDGMLPGMDGMDILKELRRAGDATKVIFLTARGQEIDRVLGLELGADDYVVKPFSLRELMARIRAHLRRSEVRSREVWVLGSARIDFKACHVSRGDVVVSLSPTELKMLRYFSKHIGEVVSRKDFLTEVWGYERVPSTRTVDFHILRLRQKVEADPAKPQHILTVHGIGYRVIS